MRAFLAAPPDPVWAEGARRLIERLRPGSPPASWTRPGSWHVTLKFLGEVSADGVERFARDIDDAVSRVRASDPSGERRVLVSSGALLLPDGGRPRVLGVGFEPTSTAWAALQAIAEAAESASRRLGAAAETRPFRPHVTLARVRRPWPREAVERFRSEADAGALPDWLVRSCVLYASRLDPSGAVHTPLRDWALAGSDAAVHA